MPNKLLERKTAYIIGSLSQADEIEKFAKSLENLNVIYVRLEPQKTFKQCVSECFDNIDKADIIYVITKPDGSIGQGVTYELEYANRLGKEIKMVCSKKKIISEQNHENIER